MLKWLRNLLREVRGAVSLAEKNENTVSKFSNAGSSPLSIWEMKIQENAVHRSSSPDLLNLKIKSTLIHTEVFAALLSKMEQNKNHRNQGSFTFLIVLLNLFPLLP